MEIDDVHNENLRKVSSRKVKTRRQNVKERMQKFKLSEEAIKKICVMIKNKNTNSSSNYSSRQKTLKMKLQEDSTQLQKQAGPKQLLMKYFNSKQVNIKNSKITPVLNNTTSQERLVQMMNFTDKLHVQQQLRDRDRQMKIDEMKKQQASLQKSIHSNMKKFRRRRRKKAKSINTAQNNLKYQQLQQISVLIRATKLKAKRQIQKNLHQ